MQTQPIRYGDIKTFWAKYLNNPYKKLSGFYNLTQQECEEDNQDNNLILPCFDYTYPMLIKLFKSLDNRIPIYKSGTTNKADPTAYTKGKITFKYGDQEYTITTTNCWGTEFTLYQKQGIKEIQLGGIYLDTDNGGSLHPRKEWDWKYLPIIRHCVNTNPIIEPSDSEMDPMGSLSDYE